MMGQKLNLSKMVMVCNLLLPMCLLPVEELRAQSTQSRAVEKATTVSLELGLSGLSPSRLELEPGLYQFRLNNRGVLGSFSLQLKDDKGNKIDESKEPKQAERKALLIRLNPGERVLQIEGQPLWRCVVSVKPAAR